MKRITQELCLTQLVSVLGTTEILVPNLVYL